jgi:hypothetical protein
MVYTTDNISQPINDIEIIHLLDFLAEQHKLKYMKVERYV